MEGQIVRPVILLWQIFAILEKNYSVTISLFSEKQFWQQRSSYVFWVGSYIFLRASEFSLGEEEELTQELYMVRSL
jgi:hypothetical protein